MITLYNDDCFNTFSKIEDKSIDFILCDLPYGVTQNKKDIALPLGKLWFQYERIIKDSGCIALFCQGKFFIDLVNSNRKLFRYDLVWDKSLVSGFLNANRMPLRQHEQIAIFYKKQPTYNPQFHIGNPLHSKGKSVFDKEITNNNYGQFKVIDDSRAGSVEKYPTSILRFSKTHPSCCKHPTEKPVDLLAWLIKTYTNEGDTVLDNCMGSGSTGVACVKTSRNFIGMEIDEEYFSVAKNRIDEERGKEGLF